MSINNLSEHRKRILKVCEEFGLSTTASISVLECVSAYEKYEKLPKASLDEVQLISDMFNVNFTFTLLKRNKIALTGIWNQYRSTYLYTEETLKDREDKKHWLKNPKEKHLFPSSNHILQQLD